MKAPTTNNAPPAPQRARRSPGLALDLAYTSAVSSVTIGTIESLTIESMERACARLREENRELRERLESLARQHQMVYWGNYQRNEYGHYHQQAVQYTGIRQFLDEDTEPIINREEATNERDEYLANFIRSEAKSYTIRGKIKNAYEQLKTIKTNIGQLDLDEKITLFVLCLGAIMFVVSFFGLLKFLYQALLQPLGI
jgi:hypothetical protein